MTPNILFVMADQFRADALGCVGGHARTPHLDALAARGCLFTSAFANSAECVPSRISLATGLYPSETGIDRNRDATLNPCQPTWMRALREAGYTTALFGKTHLHPHHGDIRDRLSLMHAYGLDVVDETIGPRAATSVRSNMTDAWEAAGVWEAYKADLADRFATKPHVVRPTPLPLELHYDRYVGRTARSYLAHLRTDRPWFCWVSFGGPHEPWDTPAPYNVYHAPDSMPHPVPRLVRDGRTGSVLDARFADPKYSPNLSAEEVQAMRADYAGSVSLIDDEIGALLQTLANRGETGTTIVAFTSDHGELNGDHGLIYKANFLDPCINVPLIVAAPECRPRRAGSPVDLIDLGATLAAYGGAAPLATSAMPLNEMISGRSDRVRDCAVSQFAGHTCIISDDLKVEFDAALDPVMAFDRRDPGERIDVVSDANFQAGILHLRDLAVAFHRDHPRRPDVLVAE